MLVLKKRRIERGWSMTESARRSKIAPGDMSRIERGLLIPYPGQLRRIARALGVPVDQADSLLTEATE